MSPRGDALRAELQAKLCYVVGLDKASWWDMVERTILSTAHLPLDEVDGKNLYARLERRLLKEGPGWLKRGAVGPWSEEEQWSVTRWDDDYLLIRSDMSLYSDFRTQALCELFDRKVFPTEKDLEVGLHKRAMSRFLPENKAIWSITLQCIRGDWSLNLACERPFVTPLLTLRPNPKLRFVTVTSESFIVGESDPSTLNEEFGWVLYPSVEFPGHTCAPLTSVPAKGFVMLARSPSSGDLWSNDDMARRAFLDGFCNKHYPVFTYRGAVETEDGELRLFSHGPSLIVNEP